MVDCTDWPQPQSAVECIMAGALHLDINSSGRRFHLPRLHYLRGHLAEARIHHLVDEGFMSSMHEICHAAHCCTAELGGV